MMNHSDIRSLKITRHAREQMHAREVSFAEVVSALAEPDVVEPHKGARRFVRGELVLVVIEDEATDRPVLITVLWRRPERWTSAQMRGR
jgi:hypothetical protein